MMDDKAAMMATTMQSYVRVDGKSSGGVESGLVGPQLMHYDNWRSSGWDVITHAGFLTYSHHDAGGLSTFSYIRTGAKLWGYIVLDGVDDADQEAVIEGWSKYYGTAMASETYNKGVKLGTILLERGAVLWVPSFSNSCSSLNCVSIQPPGLNHMVYTPVPTVMSGGHFLAYDTMHLTEFALVFDLGLDQNRVRRVEATNALHPGVLRSVYRMAIALPQYVQSRGAC